MLIVCLYAMCDLDVEGKDQCQKLKIGTCSAV